MSTCAICQSPLQPGEETASCPCCQARYHAECWRENQGCAVYGCSQVPPTEARDRLEIAAAYWGREEKPCPVCGKTILAAAVRCRHCGAAFQSARPETAHEFRSRMGHQQRQPGLRMGAIWLFILCVLPCTAPLAALVGTGWYLSHRADIRGLPGVYRGLALLGLTIAAVQTLLIIGLTVLYEVWQRP